MSLQIHEVNQILSSVVQWKPRNVIALGLCQSGMRMITIANSSEYLKSDLGFCSSDHINRMITSISYKKVDA